MFSPLHSCPHVFQLSQHACPEEDSGVSNLVHAGTDPEVLQQYLAHLQVSSSPSCRRRPTILRNVEYSRPASLPAISTLLDGLLCSVPNTMKWRWRPAAAFW